MADPISEDSIRELIESLNRLTRSIESGASKPSGSGDADFINNVSGKFDKVFDKMSKSQARREAKAAAEAAKAAGKHWKDQASAASEAREKVDQRFRSATQNTSRAMNELGKNFSSMVKQMYSGTEGVSMFAKGAESAVSSIRSVTDNLGPFARGVGIATSALLKMAAVATEQSDKQFKAFQNLSRAGAVAADGMMGVNELMRNFSLGVDQLGHLTQLVTENSRAFAMLQGNVKEGAKTLGQVSQTFEDSGLRKQFLALGMTVPEINEAMAGYISIQTRTGRAQQMDNRQLSASIAEYIRETEAITKLTGATRKEQEEARRQGLAIEQLRFKVEKARASGDERLIAEAEGLMNTFVNLKAVDPSGELAAGFASMATGFVTEAGKGLFMLTGGDALTAAQDTNLTAAQRTQAILTSMNTGLDTAFGDMAQFGKFKEVLNISYGSAQDAAKFARDYASNFEEALKIQKGMADPKVMESTTQAQINAAEADIIRMKNLQDFVELGVKPATHAASLLSQSLTSLSELLPGANDLIGESGKEVGRRMGESILEGFLPGLSKITDRLVPPTERGTEAGRSRPLWDVTGEGKDVKKYAIGGIASGPKSGYPAELHGTEAVVPLPDGKTIPVSIKGAIGQQGTDMSSFTDSLTKFSDVIKQSSASAISAHSFEFENVLSKFDNSVEKLVGTEKEKSGFDKIIDMFRSSVKSFGKASLMLPDYLESGPVFGREDTDYEDKSLELLTQIKDYLAESLGIEIPSLDLGGGGGGGGAVTPGGVAAGGGMQPGQALPIGEMQQKAMEALQKQGITDPKAIANVMAQIQHESGFKPRSEEVGKYSPETLFRLYGKGNKAGNTERFQSIDEARQLVAQGPEAVGNRIYGGRMGNAPNEGFAYRGRGLIQLTGKANYAKYGKLLGIDLVSNPDLANDPEIATKIASLYYSEKQKAGVNLADIRSIGKATGYAGGTAETQRRAQTAQGFLPSIISAISGNLQGAADGGILSGPTSGYMAELHGTEAVVPLPDGKSIPVDFGGLGDTLSNIGSSIGGFLGGSDIGKSIGSIFGGAGDGLGGLIKSFQNVIAPSMDNYSKGVASPFDRAISEEFNISNLLSTLQNNNFQADRALMSSIDSLGARLTNAFAQSTTAGQAQDPISRELMQQLVNLAREQNMNIVKLIQANLS